MTVVGNSTGLLGVAKAAAWSFCGLIVRLGKLSVAALRVSREIDVLIYKVDRLGDWFLVEPTIHRVIESARARGDSVVIWGADEARALRAWHPPACDFESFALEPRDLVAKFRRALKVMHLLSIYRFRTLICLRHAPEPIRDFVLAHVQAKETYALSWLIYGDTAGPVPHELFRHQAILAAAGVAPTDPLDLLPTMPRGSPTSPPYAVIAPFSSGPIKDWTETGWCKVTAEIRWRFLRLELWVGPDQLDRAFNLAAQMTAASGSEVFVRSGSLRDLAAAVAGAKLVLTVDTFAAHLATAYDKATVVLIGGGQYGDFGPWQRGPRQRWVTHRLPCFGCSWVCTRPRVECLQDIATTTVLEAIEDVLDFASDLPTPA